MEKQDVTVHLTEYQVQWVKDQEIQIKDTVSVGFSLVIGIILGYIAIKGLLNHWKI